MPVGRAKLFQALTSLESGPALVSGSAIGERESPCGGAFPTRCVSVSDCPARRYVRHRPRLLVEYYNNRRFRESLDYVETWLPVRGKNFIR